MISSFLTMSLSLQFGTDQWYSCSVSVLSDDAELLQQFFVVPSVRHLDQKMRYLSTRCTV